MICFGRISFIAHIKASTVKGFTTANGVSSPGAEEVGHPECEVWELLMLRILVPGLLVLGPLMLGILVGQTEHPHASSFSPASEVAKLILPTDRLKPLGSSPGLCAPVGQNIKF
ncbi:hypothetical protein CgunFtcFv8_014491 [Champsocephalus gunnari]|uniref:Uncharacterized protein n=1 Tax=Champsocephalus gunnari TaxID=52237 RepID=A0AAN8E6M3_CHAGU|nr:hypothetical protein CgunFtcFv8_014491 [Champsocephalus gunnari]